MIRTTHLTIAFILLAIIVASSLYIYIILSRPIVVVSDLLETPVPMFTPAPTSTSEVKIFIDSHYGIKCYYIHGKQGSDDFRPGYAAIHCLR